MLIALNTQSFRELLSDDTVNIMCNYNLFLHHHLHVPRLETTIKKTRRGCRGGRRKQREIKVITSQRLPLPPNKPRPPPTRIQIKSCPDNTSPPPLQSNFDSTSPSSQHSVLYFNAQSVRNKPTIINDLICELDADIVFVTETWLAEKGDEVIITELCPPNYTIFSHPRTVGRGGGICAIVKNSLKTKVENTPNYESFECTKLISSNITFLCIYRPPPSSRNKSSGPDFIEDLQNLIESHIDTTKQLVILGDFNVHFDSINDTTSKKIKSILSSHDLTQLVNSPTHNKGHILDWVVTNSSNVTDISITDKCLSDHFIVKFTVHGLSHPVSIKKVTKIRKIRDINLSDFGTTLRQNLGECQQPDQLADDYNTALRDALDTHAPERTSVKTERKRCPWITTDVIRKRQLRRRAERKWRKTGSQVDKENYKHSIREVKHSIINAKKEHYSTIISECTTTKALFSVVNELKGQSLSTPLPTNIPPEELPDGFAKYFISKVEQIRNELDSFSPSPVTVTENPVTNVPSFCSFEPVSVSEIRETILASAPKSCSLDPIPTHLTLQFLDTLLGPITQIINHSLQSGTVPNCFKSAIVTPLIKKPNLDPNNFKNYRPVSNLPFLSKILEKVVLKQLKKHLTSNDLIEKFQSAYRQNHSTETALVKIMNDLLLSCDDSKVSILALLDLSAAFDTIDHSILCDRLRSKFGITGTVLSWFNSYLTGRTMTVKVNGDSSQCYDLDFGVPQGSVLGPILYTLYTLTLGDVITSHSMHYHMYADDTQVYNHAPPSHIPLLIADVEHCYRSIQSWMLTNKLKLNADKTEVLLVGSRAKLSYIDPPVITLDDIPISISTKAKNLGVMLDCNLSMDCQVDLTVKIVNFELRRISNVKQYLTMDSIKTVVSALILARLDYCNALLAGLPDVLINKLQRVQNRAARLILDKSKFESSTEMLRALHWLPIRARIDYKISLFCYNALNGTAPSYIKDLIKYHCPQRTLRSKDLNLLEKPRTKLKRFGDRAFCNFGPMVWNSLPPCVRSSGSVAMFKRNLKTHLFCTYLM